jgi:hypothetical protein
VGDDSNASKLVKWIARVILVVEAVVVGWGCFRGATLAQMANATGIGPAMFLASTLAGTVCLVLAALGFLRTLPYPAIVSLAALVIAILIVVGPLRGIVVAAQSSQTVADHDRPGSGRTNVPTHVPAIRRALGVSIPTRSATPSTGSDGSHSRVEDSENRPRTSASSRETKLQGTGPPVTSSPAAKLQGTGPPVTSSPAAKLQGTGPPDTSSPGTVVKNPQ